jgi:Chaperone of endosialidase
VLIRPPWTKLVLAAGLLALPSTAALAAQIEMIIIPCVPPLRPDECGVKLNALEGIAEFTTTSGETITVSPGQSVSIDGNGVMSQSAQDGTMLNFASAGSSSQSGSAGGGGGGQAFGVTTGGGGGGGGASSAASSGGGSGGGSGGFSGGGGGGGGGGSAGGGLTTAGSGLTTGGASTGPTTSSDIRLKHDITLLGHLDNGLGFYRFVYNGGSESYVGVMAQEVRAVVPDAVVRGEDGYLKVNYNRLGIMFESYDQWVASGAKIPAIGSTRH